MAVKQFRAVYGQTIFDVCLNCYGSLDLLGKLLQDNGIAGVDVAPYSGQLFAYDDALVIDQRVYQQITLSGKRYATARGANGNAYWVTVQNPNQNTNPNGPPGTPGNPPPDNNNGNTMGELIYSTTYIAGADGENDITLLAADGVTLLTGARIIQVEREVKPIPKSAYVWNPTLSKLFLTAGNELYKDQQLAVLYALTV